MFAPFLFLCALVVFGVVSTTYKYIADQDDAEEEPDEIITEIYNDTTTVPINGTTTVPINGTTTVPINGTTTVSINGTTSVPINGTTTISINKTITATIKETTTCICNDITNGKRMTTSMNHVTNGKRMTYTSMKVKTTAATFHKHPALPSWTPGTPEKMPYRTNRIQDIYLVYFNGKTAAQFVAIPLNRALRLFEIKDYDRTRPSVLYVHGYLEDAKVESTTVLVNSYKKGAPDTNVICLDWSNMAKDSYLNNAAPNARKVGEAAARYLYMLLQSGLPLDRFHIIGHSLGSHVAGYTARILKTRYGKIVKRLTALDPAFPAFYPGNDEMVHVSAKDAEFVDVIHTDAGGFGAPDETGTADFWPNGGEKIQPGCPKCSTNLLSIASLCSHWRSWVYYAESVKYPNSFPALPAKSYDEFEKIRRPDKRVVYMGYNCVNNATGNYYLRTYSKSKFGGGIAGLYGPILR